MKSLGRLAVINSQGCVAMAIATKAAVTTLCADDRYRCYESYRDSDCEVWVVLGCGVIMYVLVVDADRYNLLIEMSKEEIKEQLEELDKVKK